ncbi:DUF6074 family protein [Sinorhizobium meliloti]|uniref:DUF6074 family protein n=1 Tax=Rhizobium meliloti TaxID=382 RepID=UPI000FD9F971|nr:DUF6074 family protein [Sinorhizobium meliloti]RVH37649.1 hypothetical protein CN211_07320 [Sinorhizobium meliloti]
MREHVPELPLFRWDPPCKIIAFPLINRVGKIRRCAEVLESKNGRDADGYWRHQIRLLAEQLGRSGCDEAEVRQQIYEFQQAVQNELVRRTFEAPAKGNGNPQGAA